MQWSAKQESPALAVGSVKGLSRNANYDMDQAANELMLQENILNALIETQTILQLLVQKDIVSREEVASMRNTVRSQGKYKSSYEYIQNAKANVEYYKKNPEQHLRDVLKAKMDGKIK